MDLGRIADDCHRPLARLLIRGPAHRRHGDGELQCTDGNERFPVAQLEHFPRLAAECRDFDDVAGTDRVGAVEAANSASQTFLLVDAIQRLALLRGHTLDALSGSARCFVGRIRRRLL